MTARYRVYRQPDPLMWCVEDRENGIHSFAGTTWAHAMRNLAGRYARLAQARAYANHEPDDADEVIYAPGGWANG